MRMLFASLLLSVVLLAPAHADQLDRLLDAIEKVESGGIKNPDHAVGDGGDALGRYQLHRDYVEDAQQQDKSLGGYTYEQIATNRGLARRAVRAYWSKYSPKGSFESRARVHNGGPAGAKNPATIKYWKLVKQHL